MQKDRPDLLKHFGLLKAGFSGIIDIPQDCQQKNLVLEAVAKDGRKIKIGEYPLKDGLSEEEIAFRKNNKLPDDILQHLVVQNTNPQKFLELGKSGVDLIKQILEKHQIPLEGMHNVLDFGVGCGRVIRWWDDYADKIQFWGTDINPDLVKWCQDNLDFGKYYVNPLHPPTEFKNGQFDLIYLFSVFTHLTIDTQRQWLNEFARILGPKKYVLVSVHGDLLANMLPEDALKEYKKNGHYVMTQDLEGLNICASYQDRQFSEKLFSSKFKVLDYFPGALTACGIQDLFLLQKKGSFFGL